MQDLDLDVKVVFRRSTGTLDFFVRHVKEHAMRNLKLQISVTMLLGILSLLASVVAHLALTDIYHGEVDATLEWNVLRVCAFVLLAFIGMALFTFIRALKVIT